MSSRCVGFGQTRDSSAMLQLPQFLVHWCQFTGVTLNMQSRVGHHHRQAHDARGANACCQLSPSTHTVPTQFSTSACIRAAHLDLATPSHSHTPQWPAPIARRAPAAAQRAVTAQAAPAVPPTAAPEQLARAALVSGVNAKSNSAFFQTLQGIIPAGTHIGMLLQGSHTSVIASSNSPPNDSSSQTVLLPNGSCISDISNPQHVQHMAHQLSAGALQYLLLEGTDTGSPLLSAAAFELEHSSLAAATSIGSLITVVDASR